MRNVGKLTESVQSKKHGVNGIAGDLLAARQRATARRNRLGPGTATSTS